MTSPEQKFKHTHAAFTIMEVMIVVIVIGVLAAITVPNYYRYQKLTYVQEARRALRLIHGANQLYFARFQSYWPQNASATNDITAINTNLSLGLSSEYVAFNCQCTAFVAPTCSAYACTGGSEGFLLELTQVPLSPTNPNCIAGTCS